MGASMAINFGFSSKNAHALLVKLGVDKEVLTSVFAFGWGVKLTAYELAFIKDAEKHPVPIDLTTMQKLSAGTLSAAALAKVSEAAKVTVAQVLTVLAQAAAGVLDELPEPELQVPDQTSPGLTFANAAKKPKSAPAAPAAGFWPVFDPQKLKTASTAPLRDAKMMYQPVKGTSQGPAISWSAAIRTCA